MLQQHIEYFIARFRLDNKEEGQGLVEYALIIVLISIAAIVAMQTLAGGISGTFDRITQTLSA